MTFLKALAVFLGTVIGVGIFGLPFVAFKAGFFVVVLYFIIMTLVVILVNFLYAKVVLGTEKICRLPGYVGEYLGERWKKFSFLVIAIGLMGANLAYLIIGGQFLSFFLGPYFGGGTTLYTLLFFALGAYLIFRDIKTVSGTELFLSIILLVIFIIIFIEVVPAINLSYFKEINLKFLTFPYGVILFSLWGSAVIPEIKEILIFGGGKKYNETKARADLKKVILWGIILTAIIYLSFIFIVFGASGPYTSKEAISGLERVVGNRIVKLGFIFGVITCFTSFLTLALTLKKTLWYDFGLSKNFSWFLTCFPPLILFLLGIKEFIEVIGFTGSVALGFEGIIIIFLYQGFSKKKFPSFQQKRGINPALYLLVGIFILGIIYEIIYFLFAKV